jgi:uncharacterized protein YndB with AHSA1/START domain
VDTKIITISETVNVPLQTAWAAWTEPQHITAWNFAADSWACPAATNDLRVGGLFSYTMAAKDGSVQFDFGGEHTDVQPLKQISSMLGDGRSLEVRFERVSDDVTKIVESFQLETTNPEEMQRAGWQAILGNYKKHAEARANAPK